MCHQMPVQRLRSRRELHELRMLTWADVQAIDTRPKAAHLQGAAGATVNDLGSTASPKSSWLRRVDACAGDPAELKITMSC
jgi:hypothetical protein